MVKKIFVILFSVFCFSLISGGLARAETAWPIIVSGKQDRVTRLVTLIKRYYPYVEITEISNDDDDLVVDFSIKLGTEINALSTFVINKYDTAIPRTIISLAGIWQEATPNDDSSLRKPGFPIGKPFYLKLSNEVREYFIPIVCSIKYCRSDSPLYHLPLTAKPLRNHDGYFILPDNR